MTLQIAAIASSIAGLTVSGVTLKNTTGIPETVDPRQPTIFPRPDGFVSGLTIIRDSTGIASQARKTAQYNLTYRLCYTPIGAGRGLFDVYGSMVTAAFAFLDAVIANDAITGLVDITPQDVTAFGPVSDPAGVMFHGCDFVFMITEFIN